VKSVAAHEELLEPLRKLGRTVRDAVVQACKQQAPERLARVASDTAGDTIYGIDRVGEAALVSELEPHAARAGGIALVAEGIAEGEVVLPHGFAAVPAWRLIVDPIDGTRGIMYQKRSAWVLMALAPNRGEDTRLSDALVAVQSEIPVLKQHLCDELWAVAGQGAHAERFDRLAQKAEPLALTPSSALGIEHGYAMLSRFFPGARDELAAIDDELTEALCGPPVPGKAVCFEDQYASTGGQLYELMIGHDRFNADLRPLMSPLLQRRGRALGICCHPYDICTALIAREAGVVLTDAAGRPLDAPMSLTPDVAWVGYANRELQQRIEPMLQRILRRRGWL
jgi:fructose-1,6-bisphosphatase/inositol monophosphatase family enzyme